MFERFFNTIIFPFSRSEGTIIYSGTMIIYQGVWIIFQLCRILCRRQTWGVPWGVWITPFYTSFRPVIKQSLQHGQNRIQGSHDIFRFIFQWQNLLIDLFQQPQFKLCPKRIPLNNISALSDTLQAADLGCALRRLDHILAEVDSITRKINRGKGTLGEGVSNDKSIAPLSCKRNT